MEVLGVALEVLQLLLEPLAPMACGALAIGEAAALGRADLVAEAVPRRESAASIERCAMCERMISFRRASAGSDQQCEPVADT